MVSKNISLQGLNQFPVANLALEFNVGQDTFGKVCLFVWFDSLRPINNLSVMRDGSSWV